MQKLISVSSKALVALALVASVGASAGEKGEVKVGGYVDAQFQLASEAFVDGYAERNSVVLHEGEFNVEGKSGDAEAVLDVAIESNGGTSLAVGAAKSQAYVAYDFGMLKATMGQFDGLYGLEASDSADIRFTNHGIAYGVLPTSHRAFLFSLEAAEGLSVHLVAGNHYNQEVLGDNTPDFGGKVEWDNEAARASAGVLVADKDNGQESLLLSLNGGVSLSGFDIDGEFLMRSFDDAVAADSQIVFGVHAGYGVTESIDVGGRFEYLKQGDVNAYQLTVGPQFAMNDAFTVKVDYSLGSVDNGVTDAETGHRMALAGVYEF